MTDAPQADLLLRALAWTALEDGDELDRLDGVTGDGDFGSTLRRGVRALAEDPPAGDDTAVLRQASEAMAAAMGGSSGAFVGVGLLRASRALEEAGDAGDGPTPETIAAAIRAAIGGVSDFGGARPGDKTFLDALVPTAEALESGGDPAQAAEDGAASTREMAARVGRSSYSGDRSKGEPDPGAVAIAATARRLTSPGDVPAWDALGFDEDAEDERSAGARTGFVNDPRDLVDEAIDGLVAAHPEILRTLDGHPGVLRRDGPAGRRVAIVSGGGAGHEPLHAGFVGPGMLDAACPGAVFTSPSAAQIVAAARAVAGPGGVLFVVKNYTGDVLNFRLAAELLEARGIASATVVVADDIAVDADAATGRRGTGATVAVERIVGAAAAAGGRLEDVAALGRRVANASRSFGVAIHGAEMEIGVGIHGEPGRPREPLIAADALAERMVAPLMEELTAAGAEPGTPLLLQVSGLGGTPPLQLQVLLRSVLRTLERDHELAPTRVLLGDLVTSLAQPGAIVTLVALDQDLLALWDAPLRTAALSWG